jgi:hypothetical protein
MNLPKWIVQVTLLLFVTFIPLTAPSSAAKQQLLAESWRPGGRVLMDAHNCYPYDGRWPDRIDRALQSGVPLAIEQDLAWFTNTRTQESRILVSHTPKPTGAEPTLRAYFFDRIRPIMENALREGDHGSWPLITLNLDFKSEQPELLAAVWKLLGDHERWLTTAVRGNDISQTTELHIGPLLVLTGESNAQQSVFYDRVPAGKKLRVFGAAHVVGRDPAAAPQALVPAHANNYRRWWNNPWAVVEAGGQPRAGEWTDRSAVRLQDLVRYAHANGFWIRFYTLDGGNEADFQSNGWFADYNFGSLAAAEARWDAAQAAGVDFVATDHYETLAGRLHQNYLACKFKGPDCLQKLHGK